VASLRPVGGLDLPRTRRAAAEDGAGDSVMVAQDDRAYPEEAYQDYDWDEKPDQAWFDRNKIDRNKVNMLFFDKFRKPVNFFPHKLQPGDTVRITYMLPDPKGDKQVRDFKSYDPKALRSVKFDGILLSIRGKYHARTLTVRAMIGKTPDVMGVEMVFPMFSPLVTRIQVLRRGYIGRAKNAYFMRAMVGKKNMIPVDQERTEMDKIYQRLRDEGRADEIPDSTYPTNEWERYPLPRWVQDEDDWDEEKYNPDDVDQRTDWEIRVIGRFKERISPSGKYGRR